MATISRAIRTVFATLLALFSLMVIIIGVTGDYNIAAFGGPIPEFIALILTTLLLAANEGFQVGVLGSQHMNYLDLILTGNKRAAKIYKLIFKSKVPKLKKLLIGQSFFVVFCSFTIAQLTTFATFPANLFGMEINEVFLDIFVRSGLPGVIITVTVFQLLPSMISKEYPIKFINLPGIYSIISIALTIETIGLLKFVFVLFEVLDYFMFPKDKKMDESSMGMLSQLSTPTSGYTIEDSLYESSNKTRKVFKTLWDGFRYTYSTLIALACVVFIFCSIALGYGRYSISTNNFLNSTVQMVALILSLLTIFYCEGLKISIVITAHLSENTTVFCEEKCYRANKIHRLLCSKKSSSVGMEGLPQEESTTNDIHSKTANSIAVAKNQNNNPIMNVNGEYISLDLRVDTTRSVDTNNSLSNTNTSAAAIRGESLAKSLQEVDNVKRFLLGRQLIVVPLCFLVAQITHFSKYPRSGWPTILYDLVIVTGLPGVLVLLQFAQLAPQLLGEENNMRFMNLVGGYSLVNIALAIENIGITDFAWVLYKIIDTIIVRHS